MLPSSIQQQSYGSGSSSSSGGNGGGGVAAAAAPESPSVSWGPTPLQSPSCAGEGKRARGGGELSGSRAVAAADSLAATCSTAHNSTARRGIASTTPEMMSAELEQLLATKQGTRRQLELATLSEDLQQSLAVLAVAVPQLRAGIESDGRARAEFYAASRRLDAAIAAALEGPVAAERVVSGGAVAVDRSSTGNGERQ